MLKNVESLEVSKHEESQMAVAFETGQWYALISLDGQRLADLPSGFSSAENARIACFAGLRTFLAFENRTVPELDELEWSAEPDIAGWLEGFYSKAVWPDEA